MLTFCPSVFVALCSVTFCPWVFVALCSVTFCPRGFVALCPVTFWGFMSCDLLSLGIFVLGDLWLYVL